MKKTEILGASVQESFRQTKEKAKLVEGIVTLVFISGILFNSQYKIVKR